jgi:hypothetical protein
MGGGGATVGLSEHSHAVEVERTAQAARQRPVLVVGIAPAVDRGELIQDEAHVSDAGLDLLGGLLCLVVAGGWGDGNGLHAPVRELDDAGVALAISRPTGSATLASSTVRRRIGVARGYGGQAGTCGDIAFPFM